VRRGRPLKRYDMEVARVHEFRLGSGLPAKIPVIDLIEIGAGGGSLATLDARGMIAVGPRSAGADPGPVCYARGGAEPTLTDANVALGYLDPTFFLGGAMKLDAPAASAALRAKLGERLSIDAAETAWGVHETVNEQVARAFRNHAAERGFDYRAAAMVAFGGCGPLHALRIARKLRVPRVIFPVGAGVLSAVGLLASPLAFEIMQTDRIDVASLDAAGFDRRFAALHDRASKPLADAGVGREAQTVRRALDMRYRGQGYEIEVALPDGDGAALVSQLPALFAETYAQVFAKSFLAQPVEIINWKIEVSGPEPSGAGAYRLDAPRGLAARKGSRRAWIPERCGFVDVAVYDRYTLAAGDALDGPALIEERESTAVIGVGERVEVDALGNLVARIA
jgi:N-methylhydantoinase A